MFLGSLNENEKTAFLVLAKELISSDGEISEQEKNLMRQLAIEMSCELPSSYFENKDGQVQKPAEDIGKFTGTGIGINWGESLAKLLNGTLSGSSMSREEALRCFKTRRSKACALLELVGIAYCDTSYDPDEQNLIQEIGLAFGFTKEEVLAMENWVLRQIALVREAQEFFQAEVSV